MRRRRIEITASPEVVRPTSYAEPVPLGASSTPTASQCLRHRGGLPLPAVWRASAAVSGPYWGTWRQHSACASARSTAAGRVSACARALGHPLDVTDAHLVPYRPRAVRGGPSFPGLDRRADEDAAAVAARRRAALDRALEQLPQARIDAGLDPAPCEWGRCWLVRGGRWPRAGSPAGSTWADGSPSPLCGSCAPVYRSTGQPDPRNFDAQRAGVAEALTGVPIMMGESAPAGLKAYAEGDAEGNGEPWSHLDAGALDRFRWALLDGLPVLRSRAGAGRGPGPRRAQDAQQARRPVETVPDPDGFAEVS